MILPMLIWILIFSYYPLWGWYMAFVSYKIGVPFFEQQFVGFKYFIELFSDIRFHNAFKNTVIMGALGITVNQFIMPIFFALLINEIRRLGIKKIFQTISYLPHFVSWVVVAGIVVNVLAPETGIVNELLFKFGLTKAPINFMAKENYFYGIVTISELWKELGWSSIIYIAAIAGVDQELYEAAQVDGASRLRKIRHVTLPSIRPTIIVMFIIAIGHLINTGFEKQFLLRNPITMDKAEVLDLYALKYGIGLLRFSFGTAVGMFKSIISVTLVLLTNFLAKRLSEDSLF